MKRTSRDLFSPRFTGIMLALTIMLAPAVAPAWSDEKSDSGSTQTPANEPEKKSETTESVQQDVDKDIEQKTDDKRSKLVKEAVAAIEATRKALALLGENKTDEALEELEKAVGELELVTARSPDLAFVPVAVDTRMYDVIALPETVEKAVKKATEALDDGKVQEARRILSGLASEIVISTRKLPLATYPDAIKEAVKLVDDGKIDEAKQQLQFALNLLVVEETVYPLPQARAKAMLLEAEKLAQKPDRTAEETKRMEQLIEATRNQTKLGQVLGYITEKEADEIYEELDWVRKRTSGGKSGKGFFDKLKSLFDWS